MGLIPASVGTQWNLRGSRWSSAEYSTLFSHCLPNVQLFLYLVWVGESWELVLILGLCDYEYMYDRALGRIDDNSTYIPHRIYCLTLSAIACRLSGPVGLSYCCIIEERKIMALSVWSLWQSKHLLLILLRIRVEGWQHRRGCCFQPGLAVFSYCQFLTVGCRVLVLVVECLSVHGSCFLLVAGCRFSSADCWFKGVSVGCCCWFLVVRCHFGCCLLLLCCCCMWRLSLPFFIFGAQLCL